MPCSAVDGLYEVLGVRFPGVESLSVPPVALVISAIFFKSFLLVPAVSVTLHVIVFDTDCRLFPSSYAPMFPKFNVYGVYPLAAVPAVHPPDTYCNPLGK